MATIKSSTEHLTLNADGAGKEIKFQANGVEKAKVTSTGVDVTGSVTANSGSSSVSGLILKGASSSQGVIDFGTVNGYQIKGGADYLGMRFYSNNAERMRIDSAGNLLVGKTTDDIAIAGYRIDPRGFTQNTRSAGTVAYYNRLTSDGTIINFSKEGTTVGNIGTAGGELYIGSTVGSDAFLKFGSNSVAPAGADGSNRDNVIDMGKNTSRFDDIYATNGTIQTSDRNEKQDIEELSVAETAVATACKGLLRSFRWKDAVAEKGDDARIHFGIIAQDLQDAFAAEGLDAGRYAMFISSTWYEKEVEVPAVEAVEAVEATYDDEGAELTPAVEAVEAKDAYTRTDTEDEPTDGYTERTRLGVRYPELLAFIISAM